MKIEYGPPAPAGVTQLMAVHGWQEKAALTPAALLLLFIIGAVVYESTVGDPILVKRRRRR